MVVFIVISLQISAQLTGSEGSKMALLGNLEKKQIFTRNIKKSSRKGGFCGKLRIRKTTIFMATVCFTLIVKAPFDSFSRVHYLTRQ